MADDEVTSLADLALNDTFSSQEISANDSSKDSTQKQKSAKDKKNQMKGPSLGDKNPPYNNPNRFVFEGSFIYWQADVDGIDYALEVNDNIFIPDLIPILGVDEPTAVTANDSIKQKDLDFKWNPGFKVGIGCIFGDRDEWDVLLKWTWLHSKANRRQDSGPTPDIGTFNGAFVAGETDISFQVPGFSAELSGTPATTSDTKWKLLYNTIDLELGRNFFLAKNLTLRSHLGLRGAMLHQKTKVNYEIASAGAAYNPGLGILVPGSNFGTSVFNGKNHYDAIGLRGGLETRWNFTDHFCGYGGVSAAILYGQFKVDEDISLSSIVTLNDLLPVPVNIDSAINFHSHRTRSTLQAALGVMWHTDFNDDKQHLSIGAEYEVNQWFQQNELRDLINTGVTLRSLRSPGDLGLHGFTLDVIFDF